VGGGGGVGGLCVGFGWVWGGFGFFWGGGFFGWGGVFGCVLGVCLGGGFFMGGGFGSLNHEFRERGRQEMLDRVRTGT